VKNKILTLIVNFNETKSFLVLNHLINWVRLVGFHLVILIFKLAHIADPLQLREDALAGTGPRLNPLTTVSDFALIYSLFSFLFHINFE